MRWLSHGQLEREEHRRAEVRLQESLLNSVGHDPFDERLVETTVDEVVALRHMLQVQIRTSRIVRSLRPRTERSHESRTSV